ncbi:hypothetical protein [Pollutimonas sp. M17]|uniref:AtuA-related protein n=1 Tax=Pollutimonas sp. M17 TaxID=2962065 RepID=UPI0021F465F7|nr:hypothetical protein [Pollutimonas sp. M17]UYO92230.1 hypothetical protein OEG81_09830 [Pollutimonas sp. M17]HWK70175.1 hypothetical protein [Burkholderiaceae bacterium]
MNKPMPATDNTVIVPLYRLAHSRTGDKGDISNISVIAWRPELFPILEAQLTEQALEEWFEFRRPRRVRRYLIASIDAMNFVLEGILDGGVNDALNLDTHGKALSFYLLDFPIRVDSGLAATLPDIHP